MFLDDLIRAEAIALGVAFVFTAALVAKSIRHFSRSGPDLRSDVLVRFRFYSLVATIRLAAYSFTIMFILASAGVVVLCLGAATFDFRVYTSWAVFASVLSLVGLTILQFLRHLLFLPASILASSHYRVSRLYPMWSRLTPRRLSATIAVVIATASGIMLMAIASMLGRGDRQGTLVTLTILVIIVIAFLWIRVGSYPRPTKIGIPSPCPNILMVGSDTLRADRINPNLTPNITKFAERAVHFTHCYVPCARTAPSLISLLTGTWPHRHGIRDNFVGDPATSLSVASIPAAFRDHGYVTAAISDWCGGDMGKFSLGFESLDLPKDQWNLKYLIRQGPKDLRLFLTLFTHNNFGKRLLPELYYLGGIPLTDHLGRAACHKLNEFAHDSRPFFMNVFFSTTHPPFGSEYPYYTRYTSPIYAGESKFGMARLTDPWEVIRRQAEPREAFDLDQILNLYDSCVRRFDDEVERLLMHLEASGQAKNTIVVLYSDHGMEFFEHGTWGQGNSAVGDDSARIPLLFRAPHQGGTGRVEDVVRSIDVAPTLLDLAGIPLHPNGMDGISLAPYLLGQPAETALAAYYETGVWLADLPGMPAGHLRYPNIVELLEVPDETTGTLAIKAEYYPLVLAAKDRMIRKGRWKLVFQPLQNGRKLLLFDVVADPECTIDCSREKPEVVTMLWSDLSTWILSGCCTDQLKALSPAMNDGESRAMG